MQDELYKFFPDSIFNVINSVEGLEEIRIRSNRPIILKGSNGERIIPYTITYQDIQNILEKICENSIYSYENQICKGYITIFGGHRIGIVGSCVSEDDKVINMDYISGLNFRIARQVIRL